MVCSDVLAVSIRSNKLAEGIRKPAKNSHSGAAQPQRSLKKKNYLE